MNNLNKKQKIIVIIIGIILITIIGIIGFIISNKEEESTIDLSSILSDEDIKNLESSNQNNINNEQNSENINSAQSENTAENNTLENKIIVHITGEVKKTGILTLNEGARIADAIKAAGGSRRSAPDPPQTGPGWPPGWRIRPP